MNDPKLVDYLVALWVFVPAPLLLWLLLRHKKKGGEKHDR